jgi:hypothetical protein
MQSVCNERDRAEPQAANNFGGHHHCADGNYTPSFSLIPVVRFA